MSESVAAVLLPFGQLATGRLVTIGEVERGLACECFCPQCGKPLVARKGDVLIHHFAHVTDADCQGAVETGLHKLAKQILIDQKQVRTPDVVAEFHDVAGNKSRRHILGTRTYVAENCYAEHPFPQLRPDVYFEGGGEPLAIEVWVAHKVPDSKRELLSRSMFNSIEIDMRKWIGVGNIETITAAVIWTAPRHWLHHSAIARMTGPNGSAAT